MNVLGLVCNTHDSGLAYLRNGRIECVLEEERFNRVKRTKAFPSGALSAAVEQFELDLSHIDAVATPWNEHRLRKLVASAVLRRFPASLNLLHARAHTAQRNQIVVLSSYLRRGLSAAFRVAPGALPPIVPVGHHDAHAASFFVSPFEEALVLVMDGYGDDAASSAYIGRGNTLERIWSTPVLNSLGLVYTFVTEFLGFNGFGDEGKVMALAAFGGDGLVDRFRDVVRTNADGSYALDMSYFDFDAYGQIRPFKQKFFAAFGPSRKPGEQLTSRHQDLAFALQRVTEDVILNLVRALLARHPARNIVMTGGVALNCVANARVLAETGIERLWVPPCASDTGAPLGAALWHTHQTLGMPRTGELTHPYYGTSASDSAIGDALEAAGITHDRLSETALIERTATDLAAGRIVGWYQGRFEMGPRALGNRSILADPRTQGMRDVINSRVKHRESFRPFAPAIPIEHAAEFFEISQPDPFMTLAPRVRPEKRHLIPAAIHVDGTGRIQTVDKAANPRFHALLMEFGRQTGVPVLINTSFNEQEPIVASPTDAVACFGRTAMDVLAMGNRYALSASLRSVQSEGTSEKRGTTTNEPGSSAASPTADPSTPPRRLHRLGPGAAEMPTGARFKPLDT